MIIPLLKATIRLINKIHVYLASGGFPVSGNSFYLTRIRIDSGNRVSCEESEFLKTSIEISGGENKLDICGAYLSDATIKVSGRGNSVFLGAGVLLRNCHLVIRGTNCSIHIGPKTTFGGARIVNVGQHNPVEIGDGCLFSDNIEIWASDTHEILDGLGNLINQEKPIRIGRNVWVGSRVTILKGVTVGAGSVIGMGTIVTNDIPAGTISAGCPNRTLRENIRWGLQYPTAE